MFSILFIKKIETTNQMLNKYSSYFAFFIKKIKYISLHDSYWLKQCWSFFSSFYPNESSVTLYTLLIRISTSSPPKWQRSRMQTTWVSSSSGAVAKICSAGRIKKTNVLFQAHRTPTLPETVFDLFFSYLVQGEWLLCNRFHLGAGRGNLTTGRTGWSCCAALEEDRRLGGRLSAWWEETQHPPLSPYWCLLDKKNPI